MNIVFRRRRGPCFPEPEQVYLEGLDSLVAMRRGVSGGCNSRMGVLDTGSEGRSTRMNYETPVMYVAAQQTKLEPTIVSSPFVYSGCSVAVALSKRGSMKYLGTDKVPIANLPEPGWEF